MCTKSSLQSCWAPGRLTGLPLTLCLPVVQPSPSHSDVEMQGVEASAMSDDSMSTPSSLPSGMHPDEPQFTRRFGWPTPVWQRLCSLAGSAMHLSLSLRPQHLLSAWGLQREVPCGPAWPPLSRRVAEVYVLQHCDAECQLQWACATKADERPRLTAAACDFAAK